LHTLQDGESNSRAVGQQLAEHSSMLQRSEGRGKIYFNPDFSAPFKFQLTLSAQPLAGLGWRLKAES
jgi:hypothetical protein